MEEEEKRELLFYITFITVFYSKSLLRKRRFVVAERVNVLGLPMAGNKGKVVLVLN
jgi:hypothetical protein